MIPIKVIIIDDHQVLTEGLTTLFDGEGMSVTATASNQIEGTAVIESVDFDVALIDINLGGDNGLELIAAIKERSKKVLILSSYTDVRLIKKALRKGADGYLTKESSSQNIIKAIKEVFEGKIFFDPITQDKLNKSFIKTSEKLKKSERFIESHLTHREKEILVLIAQEWTSEEIAQKLYIARSTVDTHRKSLIEKLKVKNAVGLGVWASKSGLV